MTPVLLLWTTLAHGQQQSELVGEGRSCTGAVPIAGTAGYANLQSALRTSASTYTAARFAEAHTLTGDARSFKDPAGGSVAYELHTTYNVARLPAYQPSALGLDYAEGCDPQYRVVERPADLNAISAGFALHKGPIGLFYAASLSSGQMAREDPVMRGVYWSMLFPIYGLYPLISAPFLPIEYDTGGSSLTIDFIAGASFNTDLLEVRAGYTKSEGGYLFARDHVLSLFGSLVVHGKEVQVGGVFRTGLQSLDPAALARNAALKGIGRTGLYYRDLPFGSSDDVGTESRLRSGHLRQASLAGIVDVGASYRIRPDPTLSEAVVGFHNRGWDTTADDDEETDDAYGGFLVQGGAVELPALHSLGVSGGWYPSARVEARMGEPGVGHASFSLLLNDEEQLALYPFARNAVSYNLVIDAQF